MDPFPPSLLNNSDINPNFAYSHNPIVRPTTSSAPMSDNDNHSAAIASIGNHNQASEFATLSFQDIRVDSSILEKDQIICCPICKEEFFLDLEVKMLPCKHMFHTECILQWLKIKNSCPVCRFQLPPVLDDKLDDESVILALPAFPNDVSLEETIVDEELFNDDILDVLVPSIRLLQQNYDLSAIYHSDDFLHRLRHQLFPMRRNGNRGFMNIGSGHQLMENEGTFVLPTQSGESDQGVEVVESSNSRESLDDEGMLYNSMSS